MNRDEIRRRYDDVSQLVSPERSIRRRINRVRSVSVGLDRVRSNEETFYAFTTLIRCCAIPCDNDYTKVVEAARKRLVCSALSARPANGRVLSDKKEDTKKLATMHCVLENSHRD